jgi:hypothetical protein
MMSTEHRIDYMKIVFILIRTVNCYVVNPYMSGSTVKRGKIGHLITFRSKLKIVKSIFFFFFVLEKFV